MHRKIAQWLKQNKVLLVNAGSLVGTMGVTSILGFAYWWLAARQNSPAAVGFASAAISAMTLLGMLSVLGLGTLLIGELQRQKGRQASLISAALILVGGVGACAGIIYILITSFIFTNFRVIDANIGNTILFALGVSLTAMTIVLDQALIGLLHGELQFWRNTLFSCIKLAALFAADLWLSHVTGLTIYATLVFGNLVSIAALALYAFTKRAVPLKHYLPEWKLLRQLGPEALTHHALNITLQAPSLLLPVLVTAMLSPTVNAWFYIAWSLSSIANAVSTAFASTLYAVSSAKPSVLAGKLRLTVSLAFIGCFVVNAAFIFAPQQVLNFFGHSYSQEASLSLVILSLESFPFVIKNHFIALSRIRKQVGRTIAITLMTGVLELGGSIVGAHVGGLNGLSLGWFGAMCLEAVCMSPVIYAAARPAKQPEQTLEEPATLGTQAAWLLDTMSLPVISRSLELEATWLMDTLALTAIHSERASENTLQLQSVGRIQNRSKEKSSSGKGKHRLKPTRLERFSPHQEDVQSVALEDDYAEYNL